MAPVSAVTSERPCAHGAPAIDRSHLLSTGNADVLFGGLAARLALAIVRGFCVPTWGATVLVCPPAEGMPLIWGEIAPPQHRGSQTLSFHQPLFEPGMHGSLGHTQGFHHPLHRVSAVIPPQAIGSQARLFDIGHAPWPT
jgi:hypothetical protein